MNSPRPAHIALAFMLPLAIAATTLNTACTPAAASPKVVATTTFLADMAQNVAGSRAQVASLIPAGMDAHEYQPTTGDIRMVADANALIVNGFGLEGFLDQMLKNVGGNRLIIEAASGLTPRTRQEAGGSSEADPHFWMDPTLAIKYVQNIRDGLSQADPAGAAVYAANSDAYIAQLTALDASVMEQVAQIPPERRLLVTYHESLGYFADRYGFQIVGSIIPSVSEEASPSAQDLANLVAQIKRTGAPAIFIEAEANRQLVDQVARDANVKTVVALYIESTTEAGGPAPTYIDMIKYDVNAIVGALR